MNVLVLYPSESPQYCKARINENTYNVWFPHAAGPSRRLRIAMATRKPIALRTWQLNGSTLTPTACHLQCFENRRSPNPDPLITLRFTDPVDASSARVSPRELFIQASVLQDSSSPLRALVSSGFLESTTHVVHLDHQSFQSFKVIVSFLQCEDIDMRTVPDDLVVFADRWGLDVLFEACLAYAEIRPWPSMNAFMVYSLPLMRFLRIPDTFKCVFASRLALYLSDVRDWVLSDEDIPSQRRRLALSPNIRRSVIHAPQVPCNVEVPQNKLCGQPAVMCRDRKFFFCAEHLSVSYSEGTPEIAGHHSSSPSLSAEVKFPSNHVSTPQTGTTDRAPHATELSMPCNSAAFINGASMPSPRVLRSSGTALSSQCEDSSSNRSKAAESKSKKRSPTKLVTEEQDASRKQSSISLSALNSGASRSARPQKFQAQSQSRDMVPLSGKKRGRNSKSIEKEQELWDALSSQNMLYKVLKEVTWYSMPHYVPFILNGVFQVLRDKLSESEQVDLLRTLPWDRKEFEQVLNSDFTSKWGTREWRIVARAQAKSAQIAGGGEEYTASFYWSGFADEVCTFSGDRSGMLKRVINMEADGLDVSLVLCVRGTRKSGHPTLVLCMSMLDDTSGKEVEDMPMQLSIHLRAMDCSCEAASCFDSNLDYKQSYGIRRKNVVLAFPLAFQVLTDKEVARWMKLHQPSCGFALRVTIWICKDQVGLDAEIGDTHDIRLQPSRGICPCGSCYDEELSEVPGDNDLDSDDTDHPSAGNEEFFDDVDGQSDDDYDPDDSDGSDWEPEPGSAYYVMD